jgi:hypothetical protein
MPNPSRLRGRLRVRRRGLVLHERLHLTRVLRRLELADDIQRHVDARRHAGRRDHVAVVHPALAVDDLRVAAELTELLLRSPVRRRALAFEKAALCSRNAPVHTDVTSRLRLTVMCRRSTPVEPSDVLTFCDTLTCLSRGIDW